LPNLLPSDGTSPSAQPKLVAFGLERHRAPPLGAVAGFLLGVIGHMMIGG